MRIFATSACRRSRTIVGSVATPLYAVCTQGSGTARTPLANSGIWCNPTSSWCLRLLLTAAWPLTLRAFSALQLTAAWTLTLRASSALQLTAALLLTLRASSALQAGFLFLLQLLPTS